MTVSDHDAGRAATPGPRMNRDEYMQWNTDRAAMSRRFIAHTAITKHLTTLLRSHCDIAVVDTSRGDTHLHDDTIGELAGLIAGDAELARLYRAQIWAMSGEAS